MTDDTSVATVTDQEFTVQELGQVRSLVRRAAAAVAGLTAATIDNLVTAVNEIAANAIRYAGGRGWITIRSCPKGIAVDITDRGPGIRGNLRDDRASVGATGGRGLWMARRLCHYLDIATSPNGSTVTLAAVVA